MTQAEQSKLYRTDYNAWLTWKMAQVGQYQTEAEAQSAADQENAARTRDLFHYSPTRNHNGGWDVGMASCDG